MHAFEPVHCKYFKENTNHLDNVTLYEHAVSNHEGTVDMFINKQNSGGCAVVHEGIIDYLYRKNMVVNSTPFPCKPLDHYNFKDVDFIKIDVEGYNIPVIEGMKNLLENNNPVLHIEIANDEKYNKKFEQLISSLGYRQYSHYGKIDRFYKR